MSFLTPIEKEWMAQRHFNLTHHVIKRIKNDNKKLDPDELLGVATLGLYKALNSFNTAFGCSFATYAYRCIHNELCYYIRNQKNPIKYNVSMSTILSTDKNGHALELEDTITQDTETMEKNAEQMLIEEDRKGQIMKAIEFLSEKQQKVIILRFGLKNTPPMTQNEVAQKIGMSQANVSKVEHEALDRLQNLLHKYSEEI